MPFKTTLPPRFWSKLHADEYGCWLWLSATTEKGYGEFWIGGGRKGRVHRLAYIDFIGPIPEGLTLDHLCRIRICANPLHVEPVTQAENLRRSPEWAGNRQVCTHGHAFTESNTYHKPGGGRLCRMCMVDRRARWAA